MVAIMALMESPAIIIGLILISIFNKDKSELIKKISVIKHSFTNGKVLLILGSLIIGYVANVKQSEGIKRFTNDLFKGLLAIFIFRHGYKHWQKAKSIFLIRLVS
jgi:hypothetical protein